MKKITTIFTILIAAAMLLSACGTPAPTAAPAPATQAPAAPVLVPTATLAPTATEAPTKAPFKVGFVTDTAGIADKSFNQTQWEGIERAATELGITAQYAQSTEASQYTRGRKKSGETLMEVRSDTNVQIVRRI